MKALAGERNKLAHGHFEQNPFDGDYQIRGRKARFDVTPQDIDRLSQRADDVWDDLRSIETFFMFDDVVVPPQPKEPLP